MCRSKERLPVVKNEEVTLDIVGMNHDGDGVGKINGYTLFVKNVLPGERVVVKVVKMKKSYGYGKALRILEPSSHRVHPPCVIYDQCGGCQVQHMQYDSQLKWKQQLVIDSLERIGKFQVHKNGSARGEHPTDRTNKSAVFVHETIGMDDPWRYRNKVQVPLAKVGGKLQGGFYARASHRIIDMDTCLIQHEDSDHVLTAVKQIGTELGVSTYDEQTGQGVLRHVMVKRSFHTGEMMIVFITNGVTFPQSERWVREIRERFPSVVSICQNSNTARTNVILGNKTSVLWGRPFIYDWIGNTKFCISARSFYQVNPIQTNVLYTKTLEYAQLTGQETVIDAYCGIGTIALFLAPFAKHVYGIEIVKEAIDDARVNAELNQIGHAQFEWGAAEDVLPKWYERGVRADVVIIDPPRKGCDIQFIHTVLQIQPQRIVYVSCNPSTLARDLHFFAQGGYRVDQVQPVDMFPHTNHVEVISVLIWHGF